MSDECPSTSFDNGRGIGVKGVSAVVSCFGVVDEGSANPRESAVGLCPRLLGFGEE